MVDDLVKSSYASRCRCILWIQKSRCSEKIEKQLEIDSIVLSE